MRDANGDVVFQVNPDGTSYHAGLEEFAGGVVIPLANGGRILIDDMGITVFDADGNSVYDLDPDGNSFHAGHEVFAGGLTVPGAGAGGVHLEGGGIVVRDAAGNPVFEVKPDGTSFHGGHETFADGITVRSKPREDPTDTNASIVLEGLTAITRGEPPPPPFLGLLLEWQAALGVHGNAVVDGNLLVTGQIAAEVKQFQIDHPLAPDTHFLTHASVESSEMMNIYTGTVVLDGSGEAWVELPDWFEALNTSFRYQLTCIGGFAPVFIAEELEANRFQIAGGSPGMKVSWQVTAVRQDRYARENPLVVERLKPGLSAAGPAFIPGSRLP